MTNTPIRFLTLIIVAIGLSIVVNGTVASTISSDDSVSIAPSFEDSVAEATKVARIRIIDRKPEYVAGHEPGDRNARACGYRLTAQVIEAFKGGSEQFEFFAPVGSDFAGMDRDYLAVVFSHRELSQDERIALTYLVNGGMWPTINQLTCLLRNQNYVPSYFQTLWVFDPKAAEKWNGEWLTTATRPDGLFCGYQARDVHPRHTEIRNWNSANRRTYVIKWQDVRQQIIDAVAHRANGSYEMCNRTPPTPGLSSPE